MTRHARLRILQAKQLFYSNHTMNTAESIITIGSGALLLPCLYLILPAISGIDVLEIIYTIVVGVYVITLAALFFGMAWRLLLRGR